MKKIYISIILAMSILSSSAQTAAVSSYSINPTNPTPADSVRIYIQWNFSQSPCSVDFPAYYDTTIGNVVYGGSIYCIGSSSFPCTGFDTVITPPLPPAQYLLSFALTIETGGGCVPATTVFDTTVHFTVSMPTGMYSYGDDKAIQILPNANGGKFIVKQKAGEQSVLKIFSVEGALMKSVFLDAVETEVSCKFSPGIYLAVSETKARRFFSKLIVTQ